MSGLKAKTSSAILAVSDIERARQFYSDVLGLDLSDDGMEGVLVYKTGPTHLVVYPSGSAAPTKPTPSCGAVARIPKSLRRNCAPRA